MNARRILGLAALLALAVSMPRQAQAVIAYDIAGGTAGNQAYGNVLGADFNVEYAINVTALGAFDSGSDGMGATITTQLWSRNEGALVGTARSNYLDDSAGGSAPLASATFTPGDPGVLEGGNRFKDIPGGGLILQPGPYTIVAYGYNAAEYNGNMGVANPVFPGGTMNDGGGSISFVGFGRHTDFSIGGTVDTGPANRFGTGTFKFEAADPLPVPITLQNATASYSQPSFGVGGTIDGSMGTGWANSGLGDNRAVFETATDVGFDAGTDLTFAITSGGFVDHTLGKFRLSVTDDVRGTFAAGVGAANWVPVVVNSVSSDNGYNPATTVADYGNTVFELGQDNSILASGPMLPNVIENYTVKATTGLTGITGVRLETLTDSTLPDPNGGPGRASGNGNFVVWEFSMAAKATTGAVPLKTATALFSQVGNFGVATAIDGQYDLQPQNPGWANAGNPHDYNAAVFETVNAVGFDEGTRLTFELVSGGWAPGNHTLGRFQLYVTTADPNSFADGLATGGDVGGDVGGQGSIWTLLDPSTFESDNGGLPGNDTTLTEQPDKSLLATGDVAAGAVETYTVTALTELTGITGIRLETLDAGNGLGPGRADNGNYVLREFRVSATPVPEPSTAVLVIVGLIAAALAGRRRVV